jgi:quinoprotein glucose dehydrogenase
MRPVTGILLLVAFASLSWNTFAQDSEPIWAGVYTAAQAERGRAVIQQHCAECHGEDISGGEGPALVGSSFMAKWETHPVQRLFEKIRDTMPSRGSTEVSEKEKLETVAFILQQNGFPAGATELSDQSPSFASIRMMPKGGAGSPRPGALVQVVGCLQDRAPNQWIVTDATDPQVTTLDPVSAEQKQGLAGGAGTQTIELMSVYPSPVALRQHKVLVKGLFIKTASATRINVTVLEPLAPTCK